MIGNANNIPSYKVAVVDDHVLLRSALARLICSYENYTVAFEASNGKEFIEKLSKQVLPDIVLLDINMPEMDGYETARWLTKHHPHIKILALSMESDDTNIIQMIKLGAKGFLMKNVEPEELNGALDSVLDKDFYLSDTISGKVISGLQSGAQKASEPETLTEKEKDFLRLICTELTYKDIAERLFISPRTLDDYRNALFEKLNVHSRMGLAIYALRNKLVDINQL
ncbi:DNA-binding response regulator [Deltaproteobacteria bacterium]|uniref:response regulator transcription factor n=1 Tax=Hydrotalea TaxID=1004300 RepID=UPI0009444D5F|nr:MULTISPECIES: response regulator transcription factor [Hydrotalea]NIM34280.1 response regulator [Hydrotalea flava]GHV51348.1 DNA-binding response regulator [Deltaproteobacteria bacterium]NIM37104.1 response regulator [Hydrotalea flava]NIN02299.1 response regulator [Hydrotalea flava]NIN13949.1 response regulator [Hydrotalea flava]